METNPLYIRGDWHSGTGTIDVADPATGEAFARVATVGEPETRDALEAAREALPAWRETPAAERGERLRAVAERLEARAAEIAGTLTRENGKPLAQSKGELRMAVDHLRFFAEEARRAYGRVVPPQAEGKRHLIRKQPVGVVGAITPWNFPLMLAARKVAPALAAGCPVVLKPAEETPLCALELARAAHEAQLPAGLLQVVAGDPRAIGRRMLGSPVCRKITFTGSTAVGKELIAGAAQTVTKLSLELGGHGPVLVFDDADLELAVEQTAMAKLRNTGQSCIAANRIYVQRGIHDRFVERFAERMRRAKVGPGTEEGVEIGPLIDGEAVERALAHVADATERGARLVAGGGRSGTTGHFLEPTLLTDVPAEARCMNEETFAPIAPLAAFDTEAEAIERANDTPYGLAAYAFTSDLNRGMRVSEALEAGTVGLNDGVPTTSQCPFGGFKESGWGRELGAEGLDAFLETKHVSLGGVGA